MKVDAWSASHIGLVRPSNQDCAGYFPELHLAVVADGLGGHLAGEVASRMAVDVIAEALRAVPRRRWWQRHGAAAPPAPEATLRAATELANRRIFDAGRSPQTPPGSMGTTVVALWCVPDIRTAYWAHVGDSRLYRLRDGNLSLLTADHTDPGAPYWNAPVIPTDLPHTNVLRFALGIDREVSVPTGSAALFPGDVYLLCSDGVSGLLTAPAIRDTLLESLTPAAAGERLIDSTLNAGGRDNASLVVVRITENPAPPR